MTTPEPEHDVAIVGAGPIGLELAIALRAAGLDVLQVEAGAIGSTIGWWAPGTRFFSSPERIGIAGMPLTSPDQDKATREEYLAYLRSVARHSGVAVRARTRVVHVDGDGSGFHLECVPSHHGVGGPAEESWRVPAGAPRTRLRARRLVLAIGNMHRPRRLDVPGEDLPHVTHYLAEIHEYFGARVLVVGGRNSAVEAALRCYRAGIDVTMSYRGAAFPSRVKYWLRPEIEWLIERGRIGWRPETVPVEITPSHVRLAPAGETDPRPESIETVPADAVLLLTGYVQDPSLFDQLGIPLEGLDRIPAHDETTMETNVPGVYVAGTAVGGSQRRTRIFLETSHVHVERITRALTGAPPPWPTDPTLSALGALEEA